LTAFWICWVIGSQQQINETQNWSPQAMLGYLVMLMLAHLFISRGNMSDEVHLQMKGRLSS
jgi:hypothetical protein